VYVRVTLSNQAAIRQRYKLEGVQWKSHTIHGRYNIWKISHTCPEDELPESAIRPLGRQRDLSVQSPEHCEDDDDNDERHEVWHPIDELQFEFWKDLVLPSWRAAREILHQSEESDRVAGNELKDST